jgi:hypothetical protein
LKTKVEKEIIVKDEPTLEIAASGKQQLRNSTPKQLIKKQGLVSTKRSTFLNSISMHKHIKISLYDAYCSIATEED